MKICTHAISHEVLVKLAGSEVDAIQVKGFVLPELADRLARNILAQGYANYKNAPSIGRIGMAFYEAEGRPDLLATYFAQAGKHIEDLRERCAPLQSPIDVLRCRLDELWPAGAMLESLYGRKMYVGLSRVLEPGVTFLAHHDIFAKDAPDSFRAHGLQAQFACNIYLSVPTEGGELFLWTREIPTDEFDAMRGSSYGIDPHVLGQPQIIIQPNAGDLVIFNSRLMHAVTPGKEKPRLSLSCFVGYRGAAAPLTFWS